MKNLNVNCPINGTGYGVTSTNIVKSLVDLGINVNLFPIGSAQVNEADQNIIRDTINNAAFFDYYAPCLKIWHQHDLASKVGSGDYYVFPFFEIDTLTKQEIHNINYADSIFVASEWAKQILINNHITQPIFVAPLGVDTKVFSIKNRIKLENDKYIFFHIGKWEKRKSQDFLIQAFDIAFDMNDNVELRLLPHNPFLKKEELAEWIGIVRNSKLRDKIRIYDRLPTQYHVAEFIDQSDCGVFLSRAEGWNNEIIESMAMNKPIITTFYSAHTEYCDENNSYLVNIDDLEPAIDNKWFDGSGNWAKLGSNQLEQSVEYMRFVYKNNIRTNLNGLNTANKYSWNRTVSIIDQTLENQKSYYANT